MQGDSRNSDTIALTGSDRSQIFSKPDSGENFIRSYFSKNYHHRSRNEAEAKRPDHLISSDAVRIDCAISPIFLFSRIAVDRSAPRR
jgi:hypothetical protein